MQKLVLLALPLVMLSCIDRERAERTSTTIPSPGASAQPGRGEGERETNAAPVEVSPGTSTMGGANTFDPPDVPDRSGVSDLDDGDREAAGASDVFIEDRDVNGFSGPGDPAPGTDDIDDIDLMPADAVDAGPGMIP